MPGNPLRGYGFDDLVVPFIFVPDGDPEPAEWLARHPDYIKERAKFVSRSVPYTADTRQPGPDAGGPDFPDTAEQLAQAAAPNEKVVDWPADPIGDYLRVKAVLRSNEIRLFSWIVRRPSEALPPTRDVAAGAPAPTITRPQTVTADQLRAIMPNAGNAADRYVEALNQAMAANGISKPEECAAFLAQVAVESNQSQNTAENLSYTTVQRFQRVFGFARRLSADEAALYLGKPEALANRVYANRNGNGDEASGDGYRYRGRRLMQTTGRENYRAVGHENDPEALEAPQGAAAAAAQYWASQGLNLRTTGRLNHPQFDELSRTVNRHDPNLQARWEAYQRALVALGGGQ